ncbi:MAG: hypothetical protein H6767_03295 [Candidatus Peribacteria bacterium]|nr:MAG: hypothetical protein H6767_03295 [Candidatus Peribacteria bacterium]
MLTARHPILKEYTPEWIRHHYGDTVSRVLFSNCYHGGKRTKSDICREENAQIMIEDDMDYALEIAREKVLVLLLRKPWNEQRKETHRNIKRVDSWEDIDL